MDRLQKHLAILGVSRSKYENRLRNLNVKISILKNRIIYQFDIRKSH